MAALENSVPPIALRSSTVKDLAKRKSCLPVSECRLFATKRLKIVCEGTVSPSKYTKNISKNSHRSESKTFSKHPTLSTNRESPRGRPNNIQRSENSSSAEVDRDSIVNTDLQQRYIKATVVNPCLHKNVSLISPNEAPKSSTSSSHETESSRLDETPEVLEGKLDSRIHVESSNELDVSTVVKNITEISPAVMSLTECTKLTRGSDPHVNALAKNRNAKDILRIERLKFTDMNTHCFESQKSASSFESGNRYDANNGIESGITQNMNNKPKTPKVAHSQRLPTNNYTECTKGFLSRKVYDKYTFTTKKTNRDTCLPVQTISSEELVRFLSHYNLTLKVVPIGCKMTNQVNKKSNKIQSTHMESTEDAQLKSISADNNDARTKRSRGAFAVNNKPRHANKNPLATIGLSCVGQTVFRNTPQGTFSNWKIGGTRCAKHFANTNTRLSQTKNENRASPYINRSGRGRKKIHATTQYSTQVKHIGWKFPETSCFQSQIKMFPLSKAFHELAARDKATKQTLESSKLRSSLWPLSPTMHSLMNDNNAAESTGLLSDPMLTSAASQEKKEDDFEEESSLELSRDSLSYPEGLEKSNGNLNDFWSTSQVVEKVEGTSSQSPNCQLTNVDLFSLKQQNNIERGSESNDIKSTFVTKSENNGTSSKVVASKTKFDVTNFKTCRNTSSETASYLHCSTNERVISANQSTSATKNTRMENLKTSDYSGNLVFDNIKKPVENWNSKEVSTWLASADGKLTSSLKNSIVSDDTKVHLESKRLEIDRTLRSLTLDKLRKHFGDDSLARNLYQKKKLEADKRAIEARNKNNKDMYGRAGHCVVMGPPIVPVTSAEQLEESVNFEDLLGFDNIPGPIGLTDVFDGNDPLLGTFESESQRHPTPHQSTYYSSETSCSYFDSPGNQNSHAQQDDDNLYHEPLRSPPPLLYAGNCYTTVHAHNIYDQEMNFTTYCHQNSPPSPSLVNTANGRPVSPSTFYNLPAVASTTHFIETNTRSDNGDVTPCQNIHAAYTFAEKVRSPAVTCIREPTMSDSDSGIHSPDSTPNKYINASPATFGVDARPTFNGRDPSNSYTCNGAETREELLWMAENGNFENKMANELYLTEEESTVVDCSDNNIESNQESWERCSNLSNSSNSSVGESQTKLFNMDDCKTYIANGPLHSLYSKKCFLKEEADLINSTMTRPVFVAVSENNTANRSATKAPQHMVHESGVKRPVVFSHGSKTTPYPSFVPGNRNSRVIARDDNEIRFQKYTECSTLNIYKSTIKSEIKREPFSKVGSGKSHGQRQTSDDRDDTMIDSFDIKIRRSSSGKNAHLWEFIRDTLLNPLYCPRLIKWENREAGIFRFVQSDVVAGMWGEKKNNPKMTYEKLSRAMRYYYNREILERVDGRRLVYKFGKNAYGWRLSEKAREKKIKEENIFETDLRRQGRQPSPRKLSSNCKNAEKSPGDILHSPTKRRRIETNSNTKKQSTGKPKNTPVCLNARIAEVEREGVSLAGIKRKSHDINEQTDTSNHTSAVKKQQKRPRSSCIVYLARPTRLSDFTKNRSESNVFKAQVGEWPSDERSVTPSPSLQSKLPSAEVLLGKQYKIATVAN